MHLPAWLRPLAARLSPVRTRRARPQSAFRPRFETLEDRTTPSAVQLTSVNFIHEPLALTPVGSTLYFEDDDGNGPQLWRTGGRPGDIALVESQSGLVDPFGLQHLWQNVAHVGSWLYFLANNSDGSYTLWRNDSSVNPSGGVSSSQKILDLAADPTGGPAQLTAVGNDLYFMATVGPDWLLWKVSGANGANPSTAPLTLPGLDSFGPWNLSAAGSNLYFSADYYHDNSTDYVLWGLDGNTGQAAPLQDGNNGYVPGAPSSITPVVGTDLYYFPRSGGPQDGTLWRISSPGAPAVRVASVGEFYDTSDMAVVGGILYFLTADPQNPNDYDLWKCQGSTATRVWESQGGGYVPLGMVGLGSDVYFLDAANGGGYPDEPPHLWKSDGTTAGTEVVQSFTWPLYNQNNLGMPFGLTTVGSTLYFEGPDNRLWQSGGTPATTHVADVSVSINYSVGNYPIPKLPESPLLAVGSSLYYKIYDPSGYAYGLGRLNNPPVANTDAYMADLDTTLTVSAAAGVLANDTDRDPNDVPYLAASLVSGPSHGSLTLNVDGSFTYTPAAGYVGPDSFTYQASDGIDPSNVATVNLTVNVTAQDLQQVVSPSNPVTIQVNSVADATTVVNAINDLSSQGSNISGTVTLDLAPITYGGLTVNVPDGMTLVIGTASYTGGQQATIDPDSPAFTVASGNVLLCNVTLVTTGDAPTILVTGGHLTLRGCTVQESADSNQPAIEVTGGTVDLGTAADPGGNTLNLNGPGAFAANATSAPIAAAGDTFTVDGTPLLPGSLSGVAWEDFNDDGQVDFGEKGIGGVTITLAGTDDLGNPVNRSQQTDSDGAYVFLNLRPGQYTLTETQPAGYVQGVDSLGTAGGSLAATDRFAVPLGVEVNGLNYNFGEQPPAGGGVHSGQAAGIGFWNNKNGQALIKALNGGATATQLGNWLAATLPHVFGAQAGNNNLTGKTNAYIATLFQSDFVLKGVKLDAQFLATALSVYVTNATLDPTMVAAPYSFTVSGDGVGTATVNVGANGDAFGVTNNTTMTVLDLLLASDAQAVDGVLYNGNTTRRNEANNVYSFVNQAGNIG
jgi:hypothetical protein